LILFIIGIVHPFPYRKLGLKSTEYYYELLNKILGKKNFYYPDVLKQLKIERKKQNKKSIDSAEALLPIQSLCGLIRQEFRDVRRLEFSESERRDVSFAGKFLIFTFEKSYLQIISISYAKTERCLENL